MSSIKELVTGKNEAIMREYVGLVCIATISGLMEELSSESTNLKVVKGVKELNLLLMDEIDKITKEELLE